MMQTNFSLFHNFLKCRKLTSIFYQYNNEITARQYELPINISSSYINEGDKALDWSCGNGHFSLYLIFKKLQVTGSSFYDTIPEYLLKENLFSLKLADENESISLPFDDESFDHVFSIGVLEHVHEMGGDQLYRDSI